MNNKSIRVGIFFFHRGFCNTVFVLYDVMIFNYHKVIKVIYLLTTKEYLIKTYISERANTILVQIRTIFKDLLRNISTHRERFCYGDKITIAIIGDKII